MKKEFLLFATFLLALACNTMSKQNMAENATTKTFRRLAWLEGDWERKTARGSMHESWQLLNDSTWRGASYVIRGVDTVSSERITLQMRSNNIQYVPVVRNQNDGKVVYFTLKPLTSDTFVFENLQHDFPQRILYWQQHPDSLHAAIEGMQGEKMRREVFIMAKKE